MIEKNDIAIIGMAGRFPGAENIKKFWENLVEGVESISFFEDIGKESSSYIPAKGYLDNADYFASDFFKFTPRTAEVTDPQFRLLLECVWEAWEDAGYNPNKLDKVIGVYAASSTQANYYDKNISQNTQFLNEADEYEILIH